MQAAAQAELNQSRRYLPILDTVITLAPLLGLLGTITGMISAFGIVSEAGLGQPHAITGGIAEALIATCHWPAHRHHDSDPVQLLSVQGRAAH